MVSSNHMIIGITTAAVLRQPFIILPAAFVSHFIFDAVPHFGFKNQKGFGNALKFRVTYYVIAFDFISWTIALFIAFRLGWLAVIAGLLAASPDLIWTYRYLFYERRGNIPPENWFTRFHKWIQWGERPWGIGIEVCTFILLSYFLVKNYL